MQTCRGAAYGSWVAAARKLCRIQGRDEVMGRVAAEQDRGNSSLPVQVWPLFWDRVCINGQRRLLLTVLRAVCKERQQQLTPRHRYTCDFLMALI